MNTFLTPIVFVNHDYRGIGRPAEEFDLDSDVEHIRNSFAATSKGEQ